MNRRFVVRLAWVAIVVAYLLHNDLWLWDDSGLLLGVPVGLTYHIGYCLAVAALMALVVRFAWPDGLDDDPPTGR